MEQTVPWPTVPWPVTEAGIQVTTNGYIEEALGLHTMICGWGPEGFYVRRDCEPEELELYLGLINWNRVAYVQRYYDVRLGRGIVSYNDNATQEVTERRFQRLIEHCFRSVSNADFWKELKAAGARGGKASYIHSNV